MGSEPVHAESLAQAVTPPQSLAHEVLGIECGGAPAVGLEQKLDSIITQALGLLHASLPESEKDDEAAALRFFKAVDRALIQADVIFPPEGEMDLLCDGLTPRRLSAEEFRRAESSFANRRRAPWMRANQQAEGFFFLFDCDMASVVYVAVAERLNLPVFLVEIPGHNFVRWHSSSALVNWDPNDGVSYPDDYYVKTWHVTESDREMQGAFAAMSRTAVLSYWRLLCGRSKTHRGDHAGALRDFREALRLAPTNVVAQNELAWLLATSPFDEIRDGNEALRLSESVVARGRRMIWLQTLAAAYAEVGDFERAVSAAQEARDATNGELGRLTRTELRIDTGACLAAYRMGLSYAEAVKKHLIPAQLTTGGSIDTRASR